LQAFVESLDETNQELAVIEAGVAEATVFSAVSAEAGGTTASVSGTAGGASIFVSGTVGGASIFVSVAAEASEVFFSVSASQKEVFFPVLETVWKTSSALTFPITVTFCSLRSTLNESTPVLTIKIEKGLN
jgi:hypothetical protein